VVALLLYKSDKNDSTEKPVAEPDYTRWRFRVATEHVGFVRMIVEAYDGLAVVVTPDPKIGVIEWWIGPGREAEAAQVAASLEKQIGLTLL
jgi:hypothetical protein